MPQNITQALYSVWNVSRTRIRDSGRRMMPVAAQDPQAAVIVKLFAAIEYEYVNFSIAKDGAVPSIPSHTELETDPNYVFLHFVFGGFTQQQLADGAMRYYVFGTYIYGLLVPEGLHMGYNLGIPPWSPYPVAQEQIPGTNFKNGLLNPVYISKPLNVPIQPNTLMPQQRITQDQ